MDLSYILNQYGEEHSAYFNAIAPPIVQTSNFQFETVEAMRQGFKDEFETFIYSRGNNPTTDILRKKLAALDGAEDCLVFNSGAAAIFAAVFSQVKSGDHIISVDNPYSWAKHLFDQILPRFEITTTYIDGRYIENFEKNIRPNTTLIYTESPNSWMFDLQDLEAVAVLAKKHGIVTVCDNSYCTPIYQQPIRLGIDLVLQSATKYIGGHSDVVAGVLSGSKERIKQIFSSELMTIGSAIQPFNAWLLLRGLRTLPVRLQHITNTTKSLISFLKSRWEVEKILFPLDESFEQYALAQKQMQGGCGLVTVILKPITGKQIEAFCNALKTFKMAVSWGGYESLVIPAIATMDIQDYDSSIERHRSIRFYFGLEDPQYLINDLTQAFDQLPTST